MSGYRLMSYDIAAREGLKTRRLVVETIAEDPGDSLEVAVRVVDGDENHTADSLLMVAGYRLMTLAQAEDATRR